MRLSPTDFTWDGFFWNARAVLAGWHGFAGSASEVPRTVDVVFAPEGRGAEPLTGTEIGLVQWFVDHHAAVLDAAHGAVLARYPSLREEYRYSEAEMAEVMPAVETAADLAPLIALQTVNVHQLVAGDAPYIGIELDCTWDEEHGLGVLMHGTRVIEVGGADTAGLLWIAERDARRD